MKTNWEKPIIQDLELEETKQSERYYNCSNCGRFHLATKVEQADFSESYCPCGHGYYILWTGEIPVTQS